MEIDIKRYEFEIMHIINELENLERGIFYEANGDKGSGSAKTIARNVRESFEKLILKMIKNEEGTGELLNRVLNKKGL